MDDMNTSCPEPIDIGTLNLSEYEFHASTGNESDKLLVWKTVAKSATYALVFVLSLVGNMLVILVVACNQHMKTTINYYLVNLAVADLTITLFCMWTHLVKHLSYPSFILGFLMCRVDAFIHMTAMTSSVLTMTAISCDRFIAVMYPLRARFTKKRASGVLSLVWLFSMAFSAPFIFHREYWELKWKNYVQPHCGDVWSAETHYDVSTGSCVVDYPTKRLYYTFFTVTLFLLPISVMSVTYFLLVRKLWLSPPLGEQSGVTAASYQTRTKKKVIKLVVVLLVVFLVCWMPLQVLTFYGVFGHVTHDQGHLPLWFSDVEFAAYFVAYSNSAANPIIYCGFNENFRQGIAAILFGLCLKNSKSSSIRSSKVTNIMCGSDRQRELHHNNHIELSSFHKSIAVDV